MRIGDGSGHVEIVLSSEAYAQAVGEQLLKKGNIVVARGQPIFDKRHREWRVHGAIVAGLDWLRQRCFKRVNLRWDGGQNAADWSPLKQMLNVEQGVNVHFVYCSKIIQATFQSDYKIGFGDDQWVRLRQIFGSSLEVEV